DDGAHDLDGSHRELAGCRLARQHHGAGAIVDRVSHVGGFRASGARVLHHAFQHLGRGNHRLTGGLALGDDLLLEARDQLWTELYTHVAARHHHAVGGLDDRVEVLYDLRTFEFADNLGVSALLFDVFGEVDHLGRGTHEGQRHEIYT